MSLDYFQRPSIWECASQKQTGRHHLERGIEEIVGASYKAWNLFANNKESVNGEKYHSEKLYQADQYLWPLVSDPFQFQCEVFKTLQNPTDHFLSVFVTARQSCAGGFFRYAWARVFIAIETGSPHRTRSAVSNAATACSNCAAR